MPHAQSPIPHTISPTPNPPCPKPYQFGWFDWFCLWYPPGWLILFNRHWQHYHADPDGWNWLEYGLFLIPGGFYLALLIRWLRLGCRLPQTQPSQFDPNYQKAFREEILAPIVNYYYRGELQPIENLPETGPLIVAMNHAGMSFPWDFITLAYLLGNARGWAVQPLAGVSLFDHTWVIWWLPPGWSQVLGAVRAELDDFAAAVAQKTILLYAPEGLHGPRKGWSKRYQLQTFHPSFIRLSIANKIPILPIICAGNESLHPWTIHLKKLAKRLSLPFLPISPLMIIFILFPSMGVWAMKSNLRYYVGSVYQPWLEEIVELEGLDKPKNSSDNKHSTVYQQAQKFREKMQSMINCVIGGAT